MRLIYLLILGALLGCSSAPKKPFIDKKGKNYIGAVIEEAQNSKAIKLAFILPGASADRMGLESRDLVLKVNDQWVKDFEKPIKKSFANFIRNYKREDVIHFLVKRGDKELVFSGHVDRRVYGNGPKVLPKKNRELLPYFLDHKISPLSKLSSRLIEKNNLQEPYTELTETFSLMTDKADFYRRYLVTYVQKNPFELGRISKEIIKNIDHKNLHRVWDIHETLDSKKYDLNPNDAIGFINDVLKIIYGELSKAFEDISPEEKKELLSTYPKILDYIDNNIMLMKMDKMEEFTPLHKTLTKIKPLHLVKAKKYTSSFSSNRYLFNAIRELLIKKKVNQFSFDTPFGKVILGGRGKNTYQKINPATVALIIDLGGDDLYLGNYAGTASGRFFSMVVDVDGNDTYEASRPCSFGCGVFGLGVHVDKKGNDTYLGTKLSQGASFGGIGHLEDNRGDDHYKAISHSQAYSFYGLSGLEEGIGNDHYESKLFSQGVAVSGGVSYLKDSSGNDHYEARGLYPSSYGTSGVFRSFSQGMGFGFRSFMSGGIGILSDRKGRDKFIAGNFSQGAGYYFGFGLFHNGGKDNDHYIGSRYTQGATAHYAVGSFIEEGGNDLYEARHEVSAGMAWDLGISYFEDSRGNDRYKNSGMTMGASAQNAITVFIDKNGNDTYDLNGFPAAIPTNEARDGMSFGLFLDLKGKDSYKKIKNNQSGKTGNAGFWFDTTTPISNIR